MRILLAGLMFVLASFAICGAAEGRERTLFDEGWRFALGHPSDPARDFSHGTEYFSYLAKAAYLPDGPVGVDFDDRSWRKLDLPHDWAVETPFDARASKSHGYKAIGPRFPDTSVGWYRRTFTIPNEDLGRRIRIEFDGIFRNARIFVNGSFLGEQPSGYLPTSYDLTDYLNYGGENVVAVRVDATMEEGWFYEGAGIYRHVWLQKTSPLHIPRDGTWVRTEVANGRATIKIETTLLNEGRAVADGTLVHKIIGPDGKVIAQNETTVNAIAPGNEYTRNDELAIESPALWSIERPALHRLVTEIRQGDKVIDHYETAFGVRTLRFDPKTGFFLNGQHVVLKGTNNHQDHAGVGTALPDALQEFRLRRLKEMGSNAYRAAHHPPTPELLDACDRLGILVIDENRLMGTAPVHLDAVKQMIRRDRNHPCVILWSLGNEEWGMEGNIKGARIAATMQEYARRLDPTRLTTVAISGGWGGISTVIDVAGVNYVKQAHVDQQHADYPNQIIVGTEETTTQSTRGVYIDDKKHAHLAPLPDSSPGGSTEFGWKFYTERPFAAGLFYWTGFDYRGEPTPFEFPAISSQFGILDTCGFPKDGFYYLKSWWTNEPVLHIYPHWNWPGREGQDIEVRAFTNCDEIDLALNGTSLGRKKVERNGHVAWNVRYAPGTLVARGYRSGHETLVQTVKTTGAAAALALTADRTQINADNRDVSVVTVDVRDADGAIVPTAGNRVTFSIRGPGRIIGIGNGDPSSHEPDCFVENVRGIVLGEWRSPDPRVESSAVSFEAIFDRPALQGAHAVELLLTAIGENERVTLNGQLVYEAINSATAKASVSVPMETLRPSQNILRIDAKPFGSARQRAQLKSIEPAVLRVTTPAPQWTRSVFNGLAQVIVQSTGEPGVVTLEAASDGLSRASVEITTKR